MRKRLLSMVLVLCMVFTMLPIGVLAEETGSPVITSGEIIAFASLDETEKSVPLGTSIEDLELPQKLTATVKTTTGSSIEIETEGLIAVTWASDPVYDENTANEYVFTPVITGYTLSSGTELPKITVNVRISPLMMGLLGGAPNPVYVGNTNVVAGADITYWIGGDDGGVKSDGADENNYTVKYDPTGGTHTLTLRNATITATYTISSNSYSIYASGDLNLVITGNNSVGAPENTYGVYAAGDITISGGDSDILTAIGRTNGIRAGSITHTGGLVVARANWVATATTTTPTPTIVSSLVQTDKFVVWGPASTYALLDGRIDLTSATSTMGWSDGSQGWKWDYDSNGSTLTLKNIIIKGLNSSTSAYGVNLPANATVVLEGVNIVSGGGCYWYYWSWAKLWHSWCR